MDKPISVGDLVQVVRTCCTEYVSSEWIFTVSEIYAERGVPRSCAYCRADLPIGDFACAGPGQWGHHLANLKRVPPLEELEGEKRDEEITA